VRASCHVDRKPTTTVPGRTQYLGAKTQMKRQQINETKVKLELEPSDVVAVIIKAGLVPVTFGQFWAHEIVVHQDGCVAITLTESIVKDAPKLQGDK